MEWFAGGSVFVLLLALVHLLRKNRELANMRSLCVDYFSPSDEVKKTLLKGLTERFRRERAKDSKYDFAHFVARVLAAGLGGSTSVTKQTGDLGVNIEHQRADGLHLIQVKCVNEPIDFEPIAIIHSRMVKTKAAGGCVVTCGTFTPAARSYADETGIQLIDGHRLVDLWLQNVTLKTEAWDAHVKSPAKGHRTGVQEA